MKEILLITGSPRRRGNTAVMADAFIQAAEAKGHHVTRLDAAFLQVRGCTACYACRDKGIPCVIRDDFHLVEEALERADALVLAMPLYFYSFPAQIKAVIDRLNSVHYCIRAGKGYRVREYALLACCAVDDVGAFDGLRIPMRYLGGEFGWRYVGEVLATGLTSYEETNRAEACARAAALAEQF